MSRPGIAFLALRLAAVYCWLQAILQITSTLPFVIQASRESASGKFPDANEIVRGLLSGPVLILVLGGVLFVWAPVLANRMFPGPSVDPRDDAPGMGGLALRLMGILVGTWALSSTPRIVGEWLRSNPDSGYALLISTLGGALALVAISAWLILAGPKLARRLLRDPAPSGRNATSARVQIVAFSIVGVWIFAEGFSELVVVLLRFTYGKLDTSSTYGMISSASNPHWGAQQWVDLVKVILGAGLFLGGSGLALLWRRAHTAGLPATAGPGKETG